MIDRNIKDVLLSYVVNAAIRGGAAIMEVYNSDTECDVSLKSDATPIIDADRAAHTAIKEALGPTRIPILSEEGREMLYEERRNWEMFWLVDPLDGTVEFIKRSNQFTVNIALMEGNRAIAGVIYVPYLQKLYFAGNGLGAYLCEGVEPDAEASYEYSQIRSMAQKLPLINEPREVQRIAITRSHITLDTYKYIEKIGKNNNNLPVDIIQQGSSYKFCMLAEGEVDIYIRTSSTSEWDTAAGEIILSEAGGHTSSLVEDQPLQYNKEDLRNPWFKCFSAISKIQSI